MKRAIFLVLFVVAFTATKAQDDFFEAPNFKAIKHNVMDPHLPTSTRDCCRNSSRQKRNLTWRRVATSTSGTSINRSTYPWTPPRTTAYWRKPFRSHRSARPIMTGYCSTPRHCSERIPLTTGVECQVVVYAQQDNDKAYKRVVRQRKAVQDAIISTGMEYLIKHLST